ncbi:MAG: transglycosylase [Candidatus Saccharibacteria bacterium GW2011_GWC2_44_17]|nr:MAG: transglycosylase [Candidatus Saccharibacteria bacterium GW2011_GWC2_44_17]
MDAMGIIGWIVLGGLAGWVASMISKENGGLLKNIIVGIIGAFIGGFVFSTLGGSEVTGFNFYSFIVALVGALILIFLLRLVTGRSKA